MFKTATPMFRFEDVLISSTGRGANLGNTSVGRFRGQEQKTNVVVWVAGLVKMTRIMENSVEHNEKEKSLQ